MGTNRVLLPLPVTRTTPSLKLTSVTLSSTNSETRNPLAYKISSIARSRRPIESFKLGAFKRATTSSSLKLLGNDRGNLGDSICNVGSTAILFSRKENR